MFDGLITVMGYVICAAFGITLICGLLVAAGRKWAPPKIQGCLSSTPLGCALPAMFLLIILVGCGWVLRPVEQPTSLRMVRAIEVPIRSGADRQDLKNIMKRHGDKSGLDFVDTSESWANAPPEFRKTLYFALDRPMKGREEWEVEAYDEGRGTDPWVIFFYGVDPASAKTSRDFLVSVLRERFPESLEVPTIASGGLPFREDLVRTSSGYEIRPDRAAAYGLSPVRKPAGN